MSSSSNYNAITNLTEIIIDFLVVDTAEIDTALIENLDCNVGTIDTLTSSTATITSANIPTLTCTTGNITTVFSTFIRSNIVRANTLASSVSLFDNGQGQINFGNSASSSFIVVNQSLYIDSKDILIVGASNKITTPQITFSGTQTASKILLTDASKNVVSSIYDETTLPVSIPQQTALNLKSNINAPVFTTSIGLTSGNLTISSGKILCNTYTGLTTSSNLSLGESGDTGNLTLQKTLVCQNINSRDTAININILGNHLRQINFGNSSSGFSIVFGQSLFMETNKDITINGTGKLTTPQITFSGTQTASKILLTDASKNVVSSIYDETTLPVSNPQQSALNLKANIDNPTFTTKITTPVITLNGTQTASKILLTDASKNVVSSIYDETTLPVSNPQQSALNLKSNINAPVFTTSIGLTSGDLTISSGKLVNNTFQGTTAGTNINLFNLTTGTIDIGSVSSGIILSDNVLTSIGKTLTMTTSGAIINDIYRGISAGNAISLFSTTTTGNLSIATTQTSGNITLGNSTPASDSGGLTINKFTTLATGKSLTLSSTSNFISDNIRGTAIGTSTAIFPTTTTGSITIGTAQTSGNVSIGNSTPASDSGTLTINKNTTISATKALLTERLSGLNDAGNLNVGFNNGSTGIISLNRNTEVPVGRTFKSENIQSNTATTLMNIGNTTTTANINIGSAITTGSIILGNSGAGGSGTLTSHKNFTMGSIIFNIKSNNYNAVNGTSGLSFGTGNTTGTIFIGESITTANVTIGNSSSTTGIIKFNTKSRLTRTIASVELSCFWNVAVGSAGNIFQASAISASAMPPIYGTAQTDTWTVWDSNAGGESCFLAQNGETMIICNPGDQSAFHWQDEDTMGSASGFKFSTVGVMTTSSDRRLKRDINPIPIENDLLDKLSLIEYVNYKKKAPTDEKYYRDGKLRQKYQDIHKGLIAQDVKKIFPEVVEKEGEYHMMKYGEVDIYFNMGVQELIKRDKEKQVIIDDLTARLVRLEQLILNS